MTLPAILLAAGAGRRFGQNKLLLPFREHTVLYHAVKAALTAPLDPVILVLGYECDKALHALEELRGSPKLRVLKNSHWAQGRAESLKLGLAAVPAHAPGAVVLLGDMPLVTPELIERVVKAFLRAHTLCFPIYRGLPGRPVAIPREFFGEFAQLSGDASGLPILQKYWERAIKLELTPDEEPTQWDIDSPEDLERML
jgi:molybdenum cofactor cytidylyltransferase